MSKLPIGTRIKFLKDLDDNANGDSPAIIYAKKDTFGTVTGHHCKEGHMVLWDGWKSASFGARIDLEFKELKPKNK